MRGVQKVDGVVLEGPDFKLVLGCNKAELLRCMVLGSSFGTKS